MPPSMDISSDKRLDRAIRHVSALWFPINTQVLKSLRDGLDLGRYSNDIEVLISELKTDFALFTYVVKELVPIGFKEKLPAEVLINPVRLIRWAGATRIVEIIGMKSELPSTHQLESSQAFQCARLRDTLIVASTAEVLSKNQNLDADAGFSFGIVRELGLNLIAWNYPSLYSRVIKELSPRASLDEVLTQELGFSPTVLAMRVLRPHLEEDATSDEWEAYESLCKIGEALAHANSPETYPSATNDWKRASGYIAQALGEDGVELIRAKAVEHAKRYREALPGTFAYLSNFDPKQSIENHRLRARSSNNPHIKHCTPHTQLALQSLYAEMPTNGVSREVIERLVKEIIPEAGFTGGCVYLVDPDHMSLRPIIVMGEVRLRSLNKLNLRAAPGAAMAGLVADTISTNQHSPGDPALVAFSCSQPIVERENGMFFGSPTGVYSSLGTIRRMGVLYLELPDDGGAPLDSTALKTFKAIRQTLCDALMVY